MAKDLTRILILGGGFGGVYTARYLEKRLSKRDFESIQITLVNRENYIVFQPLLPEVVSGSISLLNTITPIRRLLKETRLYTRELVAIDLANRRVTLAPGFVPRSLDLEYDHLVLGLGGLLNTSLVPGSEEHGIPFRYLGDALKLRNHAVHVLEEAEIEKNPEQKKKLLTFVIAGGGFSGVECAAELASFLGQACRAYHNLHPDEIKILLVQKGKRILMEVDEDLAAYSARVLERLGIEIKLNSILKAVTAEEVTLHNLEIDEIERIPTTTSVVTVPAGPHPILAQLPFQSERGRIEVSPYLNIESHPNVWALGDCASVPQADGSPSPPTAQFAIRQADTCAKNILAEIRGGRKKPFSFKGLGTLGSLGPRKAIADLRGFKLKGFPAWILWRCVYLSKFPGFDRKLKVLSDWIHDVILPKDITQIRVFRPDAIIQEHFEPGDCVFEEEDLGDKVYFVVDGEVEIFRCDELIRTVGKDGVFGEIALISDRPRTATVRAKTQLEVVSVRRDAFQKLLNHLPGVRQSMREIMLVHLSRDAGLSDDGDVGNKDLPGAEGEARSNVQDA